jgi:hypothetical protein
MDDFKKHLRDNRHWLDIEEPSEKVWESIRREGQTVPVRYLFFKWAAACIVLLVALGVYFMLYRDHSGPVVNVPPPANKTILNKEPEPLVPDNYKPAAEPLLIVKHSHKPKAGSTKKTPSADKRSSSEVLAAGFSQLEKSYASVVNIQLDKVKNTPVYGENASYFSFFQKQLADLGEDERKVKLEIKKHGIHNEQIESMINIYQQNINLLKQLQSEISKTNNKVKKNNSDTEKPTFITF